MITLTPKEAFTPGQDVSIVIETHSTLTVSSLHFIEIVGLVFIVDCGRRGIGLMSSRETTSIPVRADPAEFSRQGSQILHHTTPPQHLFDCGVMNCIAATCLHK